jgi:uncharacterized protein (DUF1810 family)
LVESDSIATARADPHNLRRFIEAQDLVYDRVLDELRAGAKTSHWIWFIFPQSRGLGFSATSQYFGIQSLEEAEAYWRHPILGARLRECTELVLAVEGRTGNQIFGPPDDLKFRSSMTLFERASPSDPLFARALETYFGGERDEATLKMLC